MYATIKPACMPWGEKGGDGHGVNATNTIRAKAILRVMDDGPLKALECFLDELGVGILRRPGRTLRHEVQRLLREYQVSTRTEQTGKI